MSYARRALPAIFVMLCALLPGQGTCSEIPFVEKSIVGARLGMTFQQLMLNPSITTLHPKIAHHPCASEYIENGTSPIREHFRPGKCIESVVVVKGTTRYVIFFLEDIPSRPGVSVVSMISGTGEKYIPGYDFGILKLAGSPTETDSARPWTTALWCEKKCPRDFPLLPATGPYLLLQRGAGFTLDNKSARMARFTAFSSLLARRGIKLSN